MLKLLKKITVLSAVCLLMSGCDNAVNQSISQSKPASSYTVLEYGFSDSVSGVAHTYEYDAWTEPVDDTSKVEQTMTVSIGGEERTGTFRHAQKMKPNNFVQYEYTDEEGNIFSVDEQGELVLFIRNYRDITGKQDSRAQAECYEIAKNVLSDFTDVDEYQVEVTYDEKNGEYEFYFFKYLGEYRTQDWAKVRVHESGQVMSLASRMLGRIPLSTSVVFDSDRATEAVYEKLDTLYGTVKNKYERIEYDLRPFSVTLLEDGTPALISTVDVTLVRLAENGDEIHISELVNFVVLIDYEPA